MKNSFYLLIPKRRDACKFTVLYKALCLNVNGNCLRQTHVLFNNNTVKGDGVIHFIYLQKYNTNFAEHLFDLN